ncbi:hypothetical protein HS1genome_1713 [Sulfodiicoccus acidiphilus]|uniref:AAA+ ATPase domain-containing protein n=2 Tax=Sulfodiicoccus acidiphilus TaxID=1670455 RepID=A0A348B572_9CREN|nr:hypothetical protein HS1genome_1713 [Sulfodiicoccus acidiphilus]GGT89102.1 hypothetical protein GCM10007116_03660 [Sulfodiicoccus acidiphilus]
MMFREAKERASKEGEVIGLASRVVPISHGMERAEIRVEVPFQVYLGRRLGVGTYLGVAPVVAGTLILGRVRAVERADILAVSRVPAISPAEDLSAITTPLALELELLSEDVQGEVVPPTSPVDPQSPVFLPGREFLRKMLGVPVDGVKIGVVAEGHRESGVDLRLTWEVLRHHVLVVGTTGAGKTNLLRVLVSGSERPVVVFDVQGDYVSTAVASGGRVLVPVAGRYERPTDFMNTFLRRSGLERFRAIEVNDGPEFVLSDGSRTFRLRPFGVRSGESYGLLADVSPFFSAQGAYFFKQAARECRGDLESWETCSRSLSKFKVHQQTVDNITRSVYALRNTGLVDVKLGGNYLGEPDYEELGFGVTVVDLRWAAEEGVQSAVLAAFVVATRLFQMADRRYREEGKETPMLLVFDEAHEFFPQGRREEGKESMERMINRLMRLGRVRGIGTVLATHRPTDLNDIVLTLTNTKIALRADQDALKRVEMEEYSGLLRVAPPGLGVLRSFAVGVHDVAFRALKFQEESETNS